MGDTDGDLLFNLLYELMYNRTSSTGKAIVVGRNAKQALLRH